MVLSIVFLAYIDTIINFDLLFLIPDTYLQFLGIKGIGIHELFCLLFVLYEAVSILKNMTLCGLPVPTRAKTWIQKFLDDMKNIGLTKEETIKELNALNTTGTKLEKNIIAGSSSLKLIRK